MGILPRPVAFLMLRHKHNDACASSVQRTLRAHRGSCAHTEEAVRTEEALDLLGRSRTRGALMASPEAR